MSEDASRDRPWPAAPNFEASPRGYWGYEVDRLLVDLEAAEARGEALGPIIDERQLSEVGFGYSVPEVDAHLAVLRGRAGDDATSDSASPVPATPLDAEAVAAPTWMPPPMATPSSGASEVAAPSGRAFTPPTGAAAAMLAEISRSGSLPRPPGKAAGYAAAEVDTFFSELADAIRADEYVRPTLQRARFAMAKGGAPGYDVREVDLLLDRLEGLASRDAAPSVREANPYDHRAVSRTPYQGFSTPVQAKPGKPKSIVRTIFTTAIFLFVLYNFFRILTGFSF